ncbi:MAG TPA: ATPase [Clostridiaceae bacterium]|nr:ATPase [Clostridiaceae bacterium]
MAKGGIRRAFLGGNTEKGFYSYYNYILHKEEAIKTFIIKGGPGTGKSTLMKKIGEVLNEKGYNVEYMHCSSDPNSIDGIVIPEIKVALLDGTAPHIVEPTYPGAVDEIIDLGRFWNTDKIETHKKEIINKSKEKSRLFAMAYRYLKAAGAIHDNICDLVSMSVNVKKLNAIAKEMTDEIFTQQEKSFEEGRERKLFASAITPEGLVNYINTLLSKGKVYGLLSEIGSGSEYILSKIKHVAIEKGVNIECFYCGLKPEKIEHLLIPEKKIFFTTINKYHNSDIKTDRLIDLNELRNSKIYEKNKEDIKYNTSLFEELLNKAVNTIKKAKAVHSALEDYYSPSMDFDKLKAYRDALFYRIIKYTENR